MEVETQDLYCGAYILSKGGILKRVKVDKGRKGRPEITFVFEGDKVEEMMWEYVSGIAETRVTSFKTAMIHVKDMMFQKLRKNQGERERDESRRVGRTTGGY